MRRVVILYLIGVVVLCPVVCGAGTAVGGSHACEFSGSPADSEHAPVHCPEDADNCICEGAVQVADVRVPGGYPVGVLPFLGGLHFATCPIPPHPFAHRLTFDGTPTGLAGWGDSTAVRALLQNFRC